jgi:hypothetical protein
MRNVSRLGHDFEDRVKQALMKNHYVLLDKNKWMLNYAPEKDKAKKREYDLVLFNTLEREFYVVECKAHVSRNKLVSAEQVRKFDYVARNYGGCGAKKLVVTDTDLSPGAKHYALRNNIGFINGYELRRMEAKPSQGTFFSRIFAKGLEMVVKELF